MLMSDQPLPAYASLALLTVSRHIHIHRKGISPRNVCPPTQGVMLQTRTKARLNM